MQRKSKYTASVFRLHESGLPHGAPKVFVHPANSTQLPAEFYQVSSVHNFLLDIWLAQLSPTRYTHEPWPLFVRYSRF